MNRALTPLLFLATSALWAQPTIPQLSMNVGDALVTDFAFPISDAGPGGANTTWNFGAVSFSGAEFNFIAQTAGSTPYAADFPGATMALYNDVDNEFNGYFYFDFNGGFTDHGVAFTDGAFVEQNVLTDPQTFFTTPLSTSSSGSDTYSRYAVTGFGDVETIGTHTWSVDGYGTLILPNATYTDVLRIRGDQVDEQTVIFDGVPMFTSIITREVWWWVKAGIPFPLLVFSLDTDDGETEVSGQSALISYNGPTGIGDLTEVPMRVYPNPVRDVVTIELETAGTVEYRVLDAVGREALQGSIAGGGTQRYSINVAALTAGLYHVEVRSAEGMATQGLIIE